MLTDYINIYVLKFQFDCDCQEGMPVCPLCYSFLLVKSLVNNHHVCTSVSSTCFCHRDYFLKYIEIQLKNRIAFWGTA